MAAKAAEAPARTAPLSSAEFFAAEGSGEAKYEVSHVVGKGSYGIVW